MNTRLRCLVGYALISVIAGCATGGVVTAPPSSATPTVTAPPATTSSPIQPTDGPLGTDIMTTGQAAL